MFAGIIVGFLLATVVVVVAALAALFAGAARWVRLFYLGCFVAAAIAAYVATYRYTYSPNPNTRFHGWPVPTVVYQRHDASAQWLDFIGPTLVLAYPMNFILFALLPSIATLVLAYKFPSRTPPLAHPGTASR